MSFWRVAAGLVFLFCFLTSVAGGAEVTYSGVPGKWKKGAKKDNEVSGSAAPAQENRQEQGKNAKVILQRKG